MSVDSLADEADGHPLFLDEIVRHLFSVGAPQGELRLDDALSGRVASLDDVPRRIVELCAVAGAPLPLAAMGRAVEVGPSELAKVVAFLRVAHLVLTTGAPAHESIECFHARVRDAVVNSLSAEERRERYRQVAVALESAEDADPDLLAFSWLGAGNIDKAASHMLAAAGRAAGTLAFDRAARLYERALELRGKGSPPLARSEERALQTKLGDALSNAGRGANAARAYSDAAVGANAAESLDLRRRAADQLLRSGHFDEGVTASEDVLASIGMRLPRTPLRALIALVFWRIVLAVRGLGFKLTDASGVSARDLTRIDVCNTIASSLSLIDPIRGNLFHARNLFAALRAGEPLRLSRALALEVSYQGTAGGPVWEKTSALAAEARRVADLVGSPVAVAMSTATWAVASYLAGRFEEALGSCLEAERVLRESEGSTWEALTMGLFAIQALAQMGRFNELKTRQEAALRLAHERGDLYAAVNLRIGHPSMAWLVAGDVARVRREAREAMREWSTRGFHLEHYYELIALTNADLYEGNARAALDRIDACWVPLRRSFLMRVQIVRLYARNMRARAAVATAEKEPAARARLLALAERETNKVEREGMPWTAAMSCLVRAAAARQRGDGGRAVASLERAITEAQQVKMGLVEAGVRYALGVCKGGAEGQRVIAQTFERLAADGAADPAKLVAMVAPGLGAG